MRKPPRASVALVGLCLLAPAAFAQDSGLARPNMLLKKVIEGMPKGDKQEVSVLTAVLKPGDKTPFHTHRFPVTTYVLEGTFTLEMEGQAPVAVKAGESMVEPPNVRMTGYNKSASEPVKVIIFYVSDPDTPFLDPIH